MLKLLLLIVSSTLLSAKNFETAKEDPIDDFSIIEDRVYVTTPKRTYLLNNSLSRVNDFSKNFTKSLLFFANSDFLLECGSNLTSSDDCCFLRDPLTLTSVAGTNDRGLCNQFQLNRFHYPCYSTAANGAGNNFYMLVSYFILPKQTTGSFSRIWFPHVSSNKLDYEEKHINGLQNIRQFRSQVLSPAPTKFQTYVVIRKSSTKQSAFYFNPDIERLSGNPVALLNCDSNADKIALGFGLKGGTSSKVGNILSAGKLTHFVLYNNDISQYRICSYTEDTEMKPSDNQRDLIELNKNSLFTTDTGSDDIKSFNGRLVNDELVILYSIGPTVYKIVLSENDASFRSLGILITTSEEINKLEFFNDELVYASSNLTIVSFVPHQCGKYADCESCTELRDPHCGWCTLQNECTTLSQCTIKPDLWTKSSSECLEIDITDDNIDVMSGINLNVSALYITLPTDLKYTCEFTSPTDPAEVHITNGSYSGSEIHCAVPVISRINSGLMLLDVSILYENVSIGMSTVRYHRCDLYTECSNCSGVNKFCSWCPLEGTCSKEADAVCVEYKVTAPENCPAITEIQPPKLSRDTIKNVVVNVDYLPEYQFRDVYQCMISSRLNSSLTRLFKISDSSTNDTVFCDGVQVDQEFPEYNAKESKIDISIVYGAKGDNAGVIVVVSQLTVYACGLLASDCVQCVGLFSHAEYNCRFCTDRCAYSGETICEDESIAEDSTKCLLKNTEIQQIVPDWSPGEGGVPITLTGKSLAVAAQTIEIQFIVPDGIGSGRTIVCQDSTIIDSTELRCITPNIIEELSLVSLYDAKSTTVTIQYSGSVAPHKSDKEFLFAPLDISNVIPSKGPESGGTRITVNGTRICVPDHTTVTIGDGNNCEDVSCNITSQSLECIAPSGADNQTVTVYLGNANTTASQSFSYGPDPVVDLVLPDCTLLQGGLNITVHGSNFDIIQSPQLVINNENTVTKRSASYDVTCGSDDVTFIEAVERNDSELVFTLPANTSESYSYSFKMDGVIELCQTKRIMTVLDSPTVISNNFDGGMNNTLICDIGSPCHINMTMTQIHRFGDQVMIMIGKLPCHNATVHVIDDSDGQLGRFVCVVPTVEEVKASINHPPPEGRTKRALLGDQETDRFPVKMKIGLYEDSLGTIAYVEKGFQMLWIYIGAGVVAAFMAIFIILVVKNRHDKHHIIDLEKKHQHEIDKVEASYAKTARQEFTELTLMTDHSASIKIDPREIPYRIYCDYLVHIMFPNVDKKKILNNLQLDHCEVPDYQIQEFTKFLNNQQFLITFIDVIERQREFQVAHRCEVASYLTIALYSDFSYLSKILFTLLDKLILNDINKTPKLLLRATKSVAEKLLTNWLSLALYDYLCTMTGPPLYDLCYKILVTVELGPLDFVTHQARFALSQDKILSEEVDYEKLEVQAEGPDGTRSKNPVLLLDCDTITQVKGKLYRDIYRHQPYSQQPPLETLSLLWTPQSGQSGSMELCDHDERMGEMGSEKKFNTLKTYKVQNNDLLALTMFNDYHQAPMSTIRSVKRQTVSEVSRYHLVKNINGEMDFRSPAVNKRQTSSSSTTTCKIASEAFLPSLIRTKEHLGKVLNSLMSTVFMESNNIPAAIKCLFDYLDSKTDLLNPTARQDPEIAHVWKTNSLPLRFWINIFKNPQFLFDIEKPPIMDSYLSVIGQCFMDSFSLATMTLNKDSSANKLVYNKEVNQYRKAVDKWYRDVRQAPTVTLRTVVADSKLPALPFRTKFAVSQLFNYAKKYQSEIAAALPTQGQQFTRSDFEVLTKPRS